MTIRPKRPHLAAGIALALFGSWLTNDAVDPFATIRAEEPPAGAALYRPVRLAVVPRNVAEVGYFQPLYRPPATQALLDRVVEFDVDDAPMDWFFGELERVTGVRFVLDESGLAEDVAITSDAEFTARSAGLPLGTALGIAFYPLDVVCVAKEDYFLVTSYETADFLVETRLYALVDHPLLHDAGRHYFAETIQVHAERDQWDGNGPNYVSIVPGAVVVTGTRQVQARAATLLKQYGRLLAEYDATTVPTAGKPDRWPPPDEGQLSEASLGREEECVTVVRSKTPRVEASWFRPLTDRPRTAAFLDGPATFDVDDQPMRKLFSRLESDLGVRFELDESGFEAQEATPEDRLTFRAEGLTVATALSLALRSHGLQIVPQEDRVVVTSLDDERFLIETRRYALGDHPFLQGANGERFAEELRKHVIEEEYDAPDECKLFVEEGILSIRASAEMLDRAENILRQYARLLAEFEGKDWGATHDAASADAAPQSPVCFRCLDLRPWPERALQAPAAIDVVDMPLEAVVLQVEQAVGAPFFLDEYGFEQAAVLPETDVAFKAKPGATYGEALSSLLEERELACVPMEYGFWVTSRRQEEFRTETRLYAIHYPPHLEKNRGSLYWQIEEHLDAIDPTHNWPARINLLPGAVVVTENSRKLALVEEFLSKHGLAPPEYGEKPEPPPGPALTLSPAAPRTEP